MTAAALTIALVGCVGLKPVGKGGAWAQISRAELASKIKGGWVGQMIGVTVAGPTEYKAKQVLYELPLAWDKPEKIQDALYQDDLFVDMTFAEVMDKKGLDASMADYGVAFGQSKYWLAHANLVARNNIRAGILPPASGDPAHNVHWRDIDFQIESDFIGLMCPGMPQSSNQFCDRIGHVMNYGDGVYGGMFVTAMYGAAFFQKDPEQIVRTGLAAVPAESLTGRSIAHLLEIHKAHPGDWKQAWAEYNKRWDNLPDELCPEGKDKPFNIDAFLNAAYIAIGLLYGEGDFVKSVELATRCGQDSDCNGASAGGILGAMIGYEKLPRPWLEALEKIKDRKFYYTNYSFATVCDSTLKRAEQNIARNGGKVEGERLTVVIQQPVAPKMEVWPGPFKTSDK